MPLQTKQRLSIPANQPRNLRLDMVDDLDASELVAAVNPASEEDGLTGITFGTIRVNPATYYNSRRNRDVAPGKGIELAIVDSTPGTYRVVITGTTTTTAPGQQGFSWVCELESR